MKGVFVTGMGIISAIGNDLDENIASLRRGESGLKRSVFLDSSYKDQFYFGEVSLSEKELCDILDIKPSSSYCRTDLLAFKAFKEAILHAGLSQQELASTRTGFVSASTVGGMSETDDLYLDAQDGPEISEYIECYAGNAHMIQIIKTYGIKGLTDCINTACSSSANAIMTGAKWIKSGRADRVIVGGTDGLSKFTVNGFNSLQILSTELCQPFDANRKGLNLGEGAAFLVLESETLAKDKKKYAEIRGYGNSNDAYHPSSLSEDAVGVITAMRTALASGNCQANEIDYVNAHGTATENNDRVELLGISKLLTENIPYNSTKSYTGHTLGAAGAIEAIYSILSIDNSELYRSLNFNTEIPDFHGPITAYRNHVDINNVLSNSFGFAGNCTSLLISKAGTNVH